MALILDGNGLIQGLSAGGLPDGSIDADSLASTLDLSSKTMTFGNVTASGITFPASVSASSNPNTLDDYEEGTFTPTYFGTSTAGTTTYTFQVGYYTKIGNLVTYIINVGWSNATGTGNGRVGGLPFTSASTSNNYAAVSVRNDGYAQAGEQFQAYVIVNETNIDLGRANLTTGGNNGLAMDTSVGRLMLSGSYQAA